MKSYNLLSIAFFIAVTLVGCKDEANIASDNRTRELRLTSSLQQDEGTRANGNTFFVDGDRIVLSVTDRTGTHSLTYGYDDGVFTGINQSNTYNFFMDDDVVTTLTAQWPASRPSQLPTDQRLDANYKLSDYMTATIYNIKATEEYIPIDFVRENAKITFVVQGQNALGQAISSLVVSVNNTGYWAHPNPVTGTADLILAPGNVTLNAAEIAGRITIGGYTGSVIFNVSATYTMLANTNYLITLTPTGEVVYATVSIGGWYQTDDGIGVPLTKQGDYYMIDSEAQLFAVRKLISDYTPNSGNVDWTSAKFKLGSNIVRNPTPLRPWTPLTNFTGEFNYNSQTITPDITFSTGGIIVNP